MEVQSIVDGRTACDRLQRELGKLKYNPDLYKLLRNIEKMTTELSKLEVLCRRTKTKTLLEEPLHQLNGAIAHLEKLILLAKLMD